MKKIFSFLFLLCFVANICCAQKYDRETLRYQNTHIPSKLIYDQIKNYGTNISVNSTSQFTIDYQYANDLAIKLVSYDKVDFNNADLKVYVSYGPYMYIDEKTATETKEEKVDSVKRNVTYYKRIHNFRYPITYKLVNGKNNVVLYQNAYSTDNVRSIESAQYKSEYEAARALAGSKTASLTAHINELCKAFMNNCNFYIKDMFDFYPNNDALDFFKIKKWDNDDEYNGHVKAVMNAFKTQTSDEQPAIIKEKIKADLAYFQSFEGKFDPQDKHEDILYFCNYYNLATIHYCLDDFDKAQFYIQKLDSSDKKEKLTSYLKSVVDMGKVRTAKHFLTTTHLVYNPVTDFRLTGKAYTSDAASAVENIASAIATGTVVSTDQAILVENMKEVKGKVVFEKTTNRLQIVPNDNPSAPITLTAQNCVSFTMDSVKYISYKHGYNGGISKGIFKVIYSSNKITLVQFMDNYFKPDPGSLGFKRPTEDMVTYFSGFGVKKKMAKYFEDCEAVSDNAKSGDFGGAFSTDKEPKFVELCKQYTECK
ncbi:hypothetical protein ACQ33O_11290 [Ferruginibacter sp. SUN002]|uniref:hypothetical protein n=1 Tax=Ferruginibacter sp. SUN002 TaxID=2937789 RepID=UPI003D35A665